MRKNSLLAFALVSILTGACTHSVHLVYASDFSPYKGQKVGKMIEGSAERRIILGFTGDSNYVEDAFEDLRGKCPHGQIVGVTTEFTTSHSFLSWVNKVIMKGECLAS